MDWVLGLFAFLMPLVADDIEPLSRDNSALLQITAICYLNCRYRGVPCCH
ncbi:hypothetical protein HPTD01_552 [Halomonas sp. TD01]|nr:hypothetical protein HPTD01_552 [Halomonas sp. TD01]